MDRGWYVRLSVTLLSAFAAFVVLWPTLHDLGVTAPDFVLQAVDRRITPGLDIQGGLRILYSVDMDAAVEDLRNARAQRLTRLLGEKMHIIRENEAAAERDLNRIRERVRVGARPTDPVNLIRVVFTRPSDVRLLDRTLLSQFGDDLVEQSRDARSVTLVITDARIDELRDLAVSQAQETIKSRIAELGLQETSVRSQDIDIIVEVPGASERQFRRIRDLISQTARLEFKIVDESGDFVRSLNDIPRGIDRRNDSGPGAYLYASGNGACPASVRRPDAPRRQCTAHTRLEAYVSSLRQAGRIPDGRMLALGREEENRPRGAQPAARRQQNTWRTYLLHELPPNGSDPVGGEHLEDASIGNDPQTRRPLVLFSMNTEGARRMQALTSANMHKRMAIVLDDEVQSAPAIQGRISSSGQITLGGLSDPSSQLAEAQDLTIVLRAGALPAPIIEQNKQLIGPTLGRDSVQAGAQGALVGILLVLIFMGVYYEVAGLVANVMVLLNVFLLFGVMAFFSGDLTLPGIAGIALTVGMAVDANVLITERMREELRMGKSPRAAVEQGYKRAFWSIFDGQLTTAIAGVVMLQFGSPEIQGFAKTLLIGIATSLYTSVFCSKVMFDWLVRGLKVTRLRVG